MGVWGRGTDEGSGDLGVAAMVLGRLARGELGREGGRCVDVGELDRGGVVGMIVFVIGWWLEGGHVGKGSDAWNDGLKLIKITNNIHMYCTRTDKHNYKYKVQIQIYCTVHLFSVQI